MKINWLTNSVVSYKLASKQTKFDEILDPRRIRQNRCLVSYESYKFSSDYEFRNYLLKIRISQKRSSGAANLERMIMDQNQNIKCLNYKDE